MHYFAIYNRETAANVALFYKVFSITVLNTYSGKIADFYYSYSEAFSGKSLFVTVAPKQLHFSINASCVIYITACYAASVCSFSMCLSWWVFIFVYRLMWEFSNVNSDCVQSSSSADVNFDVDINNSLTDVIFDVDINDS